VPVAASAVEAGRRTVTVVFSDLAGSTAMQEALDPELVRRIMARYYGVMRAAVGRHDGHIEKFIGDAVIAVFGTPVVREDDAVRAVRCAGAMVADLELLNDELERVWGTRLAMRTGVNTGELVISSEGILVGDTMNTAARFEQAAGAGEVLIGEATLRLVRHEVTVEEVEPLELKGKAAPVRAWRLVAADKPAGGRPGDVPVAAPLVGRGADLQRLRAVLEDAVAARACRLVTVVGSPGLGKSRLAEEFAHAVTDRATVVRGQCEPSGEGSTFLPVAEVVREVAGIGETDAPDAVLDKLSALSPPDDPDRERLVARVAGVLGVGEQASAQETFWALRRGLEALARERPLVVVLDDLHWAQPMLLDLLEHLVEWVADAPLLIVALARPELRETREVLTAVGRRASDVIELAPLDSGESRALVDGLLGAADLPDVLLARILETTDGNPLFLGELVRMLVDEGALVRAGDGWVVAAGAEVFDVPPTIQALLSARIERLQSGERAVVERAAVIGKQFYRGAVAELLAPPAREGLDGHLAALRRKELVEPEGIYWIDEPVYRFHHVLIRDAAYRLLLKEARAVLHERFADWLAEKAGETAGEYEEVIAFHLEQAHGYRRELGLLDDAGRALGDRAAQHLLSAGRRALAREDLAAAQNLLARARACESGSEPEILWDLAETVLSTGDAAAAAEVVSGFAAAAGEDRRECARAVVLRGQLANLTVDADPTATAEAVTAAAATLREQGDGQGEAKAWHVVAQINARLGRVALVETALDHALTAARGAEDRRRTTAVLAAAPRAALWGPSTVVRASGRCLDVVRILRMTPGNRHVEALALRCQAVLEAMRGRVEAAREILAGARATLEELGLSMELHETRTYTAMVELIAGEPAAAVAQLQAARAGFESLGADAAAAQAAALLARALVARDDRGDAEEALAQVAFAEQHGGEDLRTAIIAAGARGEALAQLGELESAVASARGAAELADPTDALADKADVSIALARVFLAAGERAAAQAAARSARAFYEAKGHLVGAERAAALAGEAARPLGAAGDAAPTEGRVLGDRPAERVAAEIQRCNNARDYDALGALMVDDCCIIDHRALGHREIHGRAAVLAESRSAFDASPDVRLDIDEVLACGERAIALRFAFRGSGRKAGELEVRIGAVVNAEGGRHRGADYYEPDDLDAMLARFAELEGRPASVLGDRPAERIVARFLELYNGRDLDGLAALLAEDPYVLDHRELGWDDVHGHQACLEFLRSPLDASPHLRHEIDEVIACDDRLIVTRSAWRGRGLKAGDLEMPIGSVGLVENGRWCGVEWYQPDDRQAMVARYAELGGGQDPLGDRPPEQVAKQFVRAYAARDLDRLGSLIADDFVMVDHRGMGWEEIAGRDAHLSLIESGFHGVSDARIEVDEVLACDDRVIAAVLAFRGTTSAQAGGGRFELVLGHVTVTEDGRRTRIEQFEPDDREGMLRRYRELGGTVSVLGDRPPERWAAEYCRRFGRDPVDGLAAMYAPEIIAVDRRTTVSQELARGVHAVVAMEAAVLAMALDARYDVTEVLACDDRVIAARIVIRGQARDGGGAAEVAFGVVDVIEDGLCRHAEIFNPDDDEAMLARFRELGGGVLGGRPPERVEAELVRRFALHDIEAVVELFSSDWVMTDHRPLIAGEDIVGRDGLRAQLDMALQITPDVRFTVDEVLACDDRVLAMRCAYRGHAGNSGGEVEVAQGMVAVAQDGVFVKADVFDYDDAAAILQRYAQLGGWPPAMGDLPPERVWAKFVWAVARHDVEVIPDIASEDFVRRDHRMLAIGEAAGHEDLRATFESMFAMSSNMRVDIDEVLACDERVIALRIAYRFTADEHGSAAELPLGVVGVVEDGLMLSTDQYDYDDDAAMLARFAELGGRSATVLLFGDRPTERVLAEYVKRVREHDLDAIVELFAEDCVQRDHRRVGGQNTSGRAEMRSAWAAGLATMPDIRLEVDEVLACDERVIAVAGAYRFNAADGGGAAELPIGLVAVVENGLVLSVDSYEPEDREGMLARFAELSGAPDVAPAMPLPLRMVREDERNYTAHDADAFVALYAEDFELVDHRPAAWGTISGRDALHAHISAAFEGWSDVRQEIDEVLACDDRVIATIVSFRGQAGPDGGEFEIAIGWVAVYEGGLARRADVYEADDRQAIVARYTELGGGIFSLGDTPLEQLWAEFARRFARRDLEGLLELVDEEYVIVDHRPIGWEPAHGHEGFRQLQETTWAAADVRIEVDEVLAVGERVMALLVSWVGHTTAEGGGGEFAVPIGRVTTVVDGRIVRVEQFEPEDREAILARFAELTAPAAGPDRRPESEALAAAMLDSFNRHDLEAYAAGWAEDFVQVDHRPLGWGAYLSRDELREHGRSAFAMSPDVRMEIDEVLASDDHVLAIRVGIRGRFKQGEGEGEFEIVVGYVARWVDGLLVRSDVYEPDDRAAMLARFAELGGGRDAPAAGPPPERFFAEFWARCNARDWDRLGELIAEDWHWVDHRALGWERAHGRERAVALMRSMGEASPGLRFEFDNVIACDDRVLAVLAAVRGEGVKAGTFEVLAAAVYVVEDGLWVSADFFDPGDRRAAVARYAELGGGLSALGDTPAERQAAEYARRFAAQDHGGLTALISTDYELIDHRMLAWEPLRGREAFAAGNASAWEGVQDVRLEIDEVLGVGEHVIAIPSRWVGHTAEGGGEFALAVGLVIQYEDGLVRRIDQYDYDDRQAMLARYSELTGRSAASEAGPVAAQILAEEIRRYSLHDIDGCTELFAEEFILVDHRTLGWGTIVGPEGMRVNYLAAFEGSADIHVDLEEMLACDDRVLAARTTWRGHANDGGGAFEMAVGYVGRYEGGRAISYDLYEPGDRQAMIARYAELGGGARALGERPPERLWAEYLRRWAARVVEAVTELMDEQIVLVDHRGLGWPETHGRAQYASALRATYDTWADSWIEVDEVLGRDERRIALRTTYHGASPAAGVGRSTVPLGQVCVVEDGRLVSVDFYEPDDREGMLARYVELGGRVDG
jgi:class 3 adenylate cyclase/ketosteroid isomerase-like protein